VSYLGYSAVYEGIKFLNRVGVENFLAHSLRLVTRIRDRIDSAKYELVSPRTDRSPIITCRTPDARRLNPALREARADLSVSSNRVRISPAIYNNEKDVDRLLEILNAG
jgi:selenocysteine lyase/cysteine desulfurase